MTSLLDIEDLHTEIRLRRSVVRAVDGVSLTVEAGQCLGIVGESGCGKTMTALSIMRLLPAGGRTTSGRIAVAGTNVAALPEDKMRDVRGNLIGMVFQDPLTSLNPTMTVGDQIAESVLLHRRVSRRAALARAVEVLGLVGMPRPAERAASYPHQLSGGMRQRVMIAMALACEPKLLIADEPTTALDVTIAKQILELIDDLRQRLGMAVILVTHDLGVIAGRADRVAVMYAGRVVETAATAALFANPRHPYTEALFEALPEKGLARRLYTIPGQPPDLTAEPAGCTFAPRLLREPLVIQRQGNRASQHRRLADLLAEVGLPATAADRYPHEFSGGQRQRLGLARALILRPAMIVADEPVSALDVSIQAQILNLMKDLQASHGLTYLFISHDLSVVRYMADIIGVMYLGKLVDPNPGANTSDRYQLAK